MYRLTGLASPNFSFHLSGENGDAHRFSVVIGANGTGKSRLLAHLAAGAARSVEDRREEEGARPPLVLAVSNLVVDSFPKPRAWSNSYRYLGLRQATNTVSTGSIDSSLGPYLAEVMASWGAQVNLQPVLNRIGVRRCDMFAVRRVRPSDEDRTLDRLLASLANFGVEVAGQVADALDGELTDMTRRLRTSPILEIGEDFAARLKSISTYFDLSPAVILAILRRAYGLKLDVGFDGRFEEKNSGLSAGQAMLFSMILRIAAAIRPGSLVLIDEPEVGLHPDWQSSFIPLIRDTLPSEASSHFFIASHSPFIVSGADDVLKAGGSPLFEEVTNDVRGMSVEAILYRIFGTRVVGNAVVDADLTLVVTWMSRREQGSRISEEVVAAWNRLKGVASGDTPTVNAILAELESEEGWPAR